MIIQSKKLNFIHVPKAAGSSIGKILRESLKTSKKDADFSEEFRVFAEDRGFIFPNHAPAKVKKEFLGESYGEYFSFAFVRNPYDRLVSLYEYTRQKEVDIFKKRGLELNKFQINIIENTFEDWVTKFNTGPAQSDWLCDENGSLIVDFVGKTENSNNDIQKLHKIFGLDSVDTGVSANTTKHANYKSYYKESAKSVVKSRYRKDLEIFGYEF